MAVSADELQLAREREPLRPMGEPRLNRVGPGSRGGVLRRASPPPVRVASGVTSAIPAANRGQQMLIGAWAVFTLLYFMREVRNRPGVWPCPGNWLKATAAFTMLSVLAMFPPAEILAGWLGVGLVVGFLLGPGSKEIQTNGTLMGIPVTAGPGPGRRAASVPSGPQAGNIVISQATAGTLRPGRPS